MLRVAEHAERTDTGRQRRANEDSYFARAPLFAIADGMGGAQAGEIASRLAVEVLERGLAEHAELPERALAELVQEANERIHGMSRADERRAGMGTTMTALHVGEEELTIAHVGDSRLYRLRDGALERLTDDHSLVEELLRQGRLTPEEASDHPQRSIITRALGPEPRVEVDTWTLRARDGDLFLLCSDGLTSMVGEERIAQMLGEGGPLDRRADVLVDAANEAGGRDNITVLLVRVEELHGAGAAQETAAGTGALSSGDVRAAVAAEESRGAPAAGLDPKPSPARAPRRLSPRQAEGDAPRRSRRRLGAVLAGVAAAALVALALLLALSRVYFLGVTDDGFVAVYRGVPFELPLGVDLYSRHYVSGVPLEAVPRARRERLLDHRLRPRDDARDLVEQLERGALARP